MKDWECRNKFSNKWLNQNVGLKLAVSHHEIKITKVYSFYNYIIKKHLKIFQSCALGLYTSSQTSQSTMYIHIYIYMGHIYTYHIAIHSIHSWIPCFIGCYSNILYISESWWFDARDLDLSSGGDVGCWGSKKVVSLQEFPGKFHVPYFSIFFHHEIHCHSHQGQHKSGLFTAVVFFDVFLWRGRKPFRKVVWDYLNYPVAEDWHGFFSGGRGFTNS